MAITLARFIGKLIQRAFVTERVDVLNWRSHLVNQRYIREAVGSNLTPVGQPSCSPSKVDKLVASLFRRWRRGSSDGDEMSNAVTMPTD